MSTEYNLHKYQHLAREFVLKNKQCALWLDCGLGKTLIALDVIRKLSVKAFIVAPIRVCYNVWPEEIEKWGFDLTYKILHGKDKTLVGTKDTDVLIINPEGLPWLSKQRGNWVKRMLVIDESSMFKSHSTQRFKLIKKMSPLWLEYKVLLSGTPAPNSLQDLWSQFWVLDQGAALGKNISAFRNSFCRSFSYPGMPFTQYEVAPEKKQLIYDKTAPRSMRLQAEDWIEMPAITYNKIVCDMTTPLAKKYKKLEKEFFLELDDAEIEAPQVAQLSMKLRQFVQGGLYDEEKVWHELHKIKLKALQELVETSAGQPLLAMIQFRGELAMIQKAFKDVPVIAGGTPAKAATSYIKQWNAGEIPLLLCHPASLSHGVNLQSGGHMLLWYGLTWSLEQYVQANARIHRQGQKKAVIIHHLVMKGTVDEAVMSALARKDTSQKALLDALKAFHNS